MLYMLIREVFTQFHAVSIEKVIFSRSAHGFSGEESSISEPRGSTGGATEGSLRWLQQLLQFATAALLLRKRHKTDSKRFEMIQNDSKRFEMIQNGSFHLFFHLFYNLSLSFSSPSSLGEPSVAAGHGQDLGLPSHLHLQCPAKLFEQSVLICALAAIVS